LISAGHVGTRDGFNSSTRQFLLPSKPKPGLLGTSVLPGYFHSRLAALNATNDQEVKPQPAAFRIEAMSFADFYGNTAVVNRLREMLARDRFPHAVVLAGP